MTEDKLKHAKEQGQAQYDSIREMVAALRDDGDSDRARAAILEDPLSVLVRSGLVAGACRPGAGADSRLGSVAINSAVRAVWCWQVGQQRS
jgi:hypothetical protein